MTAHLTFYFWPDQDLSDAVESNNLETIDRIIRGNRQRFKDGRFLPFVAAIKKNRCRIVQRFLKAIDVDLQTIFQKHHNIPLTVAAEETDAKMLRLLAKHGVDMKNQLFDDNRTLLFNAVSVGNLKTATYLLDVAGLDIDAPDEAGETSLLYALDNYQWKMARFLIKRNANIRAETNRTVFDALTMLPFREVPTIHHTRMFHFLLRHIARTHDNDWKQYTRNDMYTLISKLPHNTAVLRYALIIGIPQTQYTIPNVCYSQPHRNVAVRKMKTDIAKTMIQAGGDVTHNGLLVGVSQKTLINTLLHYGHDINSQRHSVSALAQAVRNDWTNVAAHLLRCGANPNTKYNHALRYAVQQNNKTSVAMLLLAGANINPRNGCAPFYEIAGDIEMRKMLIHYYFLDICLILAPLKLPVLVGLTIYTAIVKNKKYRVRRIDAWRTAAAIKNIH